MNRTVHNLLIVDDCPEDRELYRRYLLSNQQHNYNILEATDGKEGLLLWKQYQPDVMLLDYLLPDLDGLDFLSQLNPYAQQSYLPVIMVTGEGNEAIAVKAMKAGVQDYLVKEQITRESLQMTVNGVLQTGKLHAELQQRIERQHVVSEITNKIRQSLNLNEILQTTVSEVRQFLHADRVLIFQFQADGSGLVVAESVGAEFLSLLLTKFNDPCLADNYIRFNQRQALPDDLFSLNCVEYYRQGLVRTISDIDNNNLESCFSEFLTQLQVKSKMVVPILQEKELWGLLIVHQCAHSRLWKQLEIELLSEISNHVQIALRQATFYEEIQHELLERKYIEAKLRESEELKHRILESSSDAINLLDIDGRILYMNISGMFLMEIEDIAPYINMKLSSFWTQENNGVLDVALIIARTGEKSRFQSFCASVKGTPKWWDVAVMPIFDPMGDVSQLLVILRDITVQKQIEQERDRLLAQEQLARAEAERANRVKDEFFAILSHDLRSPLTPIIGWTKLLRTRSLSAEKINEGLAAIERNAEIQSKLIDDLLDIAKILHGKLSMESTPVNLKFVVESALDTIRSAAIAKSILLHEVLPNIGQVLGDAKRLQQVLWNLLSNAIKFTPEGGCIETKIEQVNGWALIIVSDTGKGINPDFLPHIFESFRQEDVSINRKYGGLGLGLAIVRQLVEAHSGIITANSPGEGSGATFTIQLPLISNLVESIEVCDSQQPALDLTNIRIIAVDDDLDTRDLLTVFLKQYGAEVLTVSSGAEVLSKLESFEPHILVSDIGMPEIDGYKLIQQIRSLPPEKGGQIPAIALTAYVREEDCQRALASGYQQCLNKPINLEQVVKAIVTEALLPPPRLNALRRK